MKKQKYILKLLVFSMMAGLACNESILAQVQHRRAAQASVKITGVYSNLTYIEEAGDVVGVEIFILSGGSGYFATLQIAEGAPDDPVLVPVKVNGTNIEITFPSDSAIGRDRGNYHGKITALGLSGKFEKETKRIFLKRKKSYWQ